LIAAVVGSHLPATEFPGASAALVAGLVKHGASQLVLTRSSLLVLPSARLVGNCSMLSRCLLVVLLTGILGSAVGRAQDSPLWQPQVFETFREPAPAQSSWFARLDAELAIVQLTLDRPGNGNLLLYRGGEAYPGGIRRTLQVSGGDIPTLHMSTTAWASELTFGSRNGNREQTFELRYLTGTADDFAGASVCYRLTWSWATSAGLLGVSAGWRGGTYTGEADSPITGRFTLAQTRLELIGNLATTLENATERDIRTVLHHEVTLSSTGPELGLDWRMPLGSPGLDLICRGSLSPQYASLRRKLGVERNQGEAAKLFHEWTQASFTLAGAADLGLSWSPEEWFTLVGGVRFDGLGTLSNGAAIFSESFYAGVELTF